MTVLTPLILNVHPFAHLFKQLIYNKVIFEYIQYPMLEAVIVDDEEKAIQSLSWELTNFSDEIKVVASFTDAYEALSYLGKNSPDCLFLDIEMPIMDGFQFIQKLSNKEFPVVITTAYNQYAIKALKNEAIDYLLKPIDTDDLIVTFFLSELELKFSKMLSNFSAV